VYYHMLTLFRRHLKSCKFTGRKHRSCKCPIAVDGTLRGEFIRKSLDLWSWEAATKLIRDWEVEGTAVAVTVAKAVERFMADREAMNLSSAMVSRYRVTAEIKTLFGDRPLRSVTTDDSLAPATISSLCDMQCSLFTSRSGFAFRLRVPASRMSSWTCLRLSFFAGVEIGA
jgi:hypothetical protein